LTGIPRIVSSLDPSRQCVSRRPLTVDSDDLANNVLTADADPARASDDARAGSSMVQGQRRLRDALRLVLDPEGDLLQFVGVLLAVVHTEQEVEATRQRDADVRLCPAPITTIGGIQCGAFDDLGAHGRPRFLTS